jgi:glutamyl-tRNA synthetase
VAAPGSKKKLSKRDGAVGLHEFINLGYLSEAVMNYLARLGWSYDASSEIFSRAELVEKFTLDRVNSSPASHDPDKMYWIQGEWMKGLPLAQKVEATNPYVDHPGEFMAWNTRRQQPEAKAEGLLPFLREPAPVPAERAEKLGRVIEALGDRLKVFSDVVKLGRYFFADEIEHDPDAVKKRLRKEGVPAMLRELDELLATTEPYDLATLEAAVHAFAERTGRKMGDVVNPLRVATTGQGVGPGLYDCLVILGRDDCRRRIARTLEMLEQG